MNFKSIKSRMAGLTALCVACAALFFSACGEDKPEIAGCDNVKYKGFTYTNLGCKRGFASFDGTFTQDGHTASFQVVCTNGCISSVTVLEGNGITQP